MPATKAQLRALIRQRRQAMPADEILRRSILLCEKVFSTDIYRNARSIYGYLPFNQEVSLLSLLNRALEDGKTVALPKCCGRQMNFIRMDDLSQIQHSTFGAPEPVADAPIADDPQALVILPGLAFDRRGYRLGYGGGFYDRFLAAEPEHPTIALCFDFQVFDSIPTDPHDIPADALFWI